MDLYQEMAEILCGIFQTNAGGSAVIESIGYVGQGTNVHRRDNVVINV